MRFEMLVFGVNGSLILGEGVLNGRLAKLEIIYGFSCSYPAARPAWRLGLALRGVGLVTWGHR